MPASIETAGFCADYFAAFEVKGSAAKPYVVTLNGTAAAHCTCPAFRFSGPEMHCKHVDYVWARACLWNPQFKDGNPNPTVRPRSYTQPLIPDEKCPVCGGPMVAVRIAV